MPCFIAWRQNRLSAKQEALNNVRLSATWIPKRKARVDAWEISPLWWRLSVKQEASIMSDCQTRKLLLEKSNFWSLRDLTVPLQAVGKTGCPQQCAYDPFGSPWTLHSSDSGGHLTILFTALTQVDTWSSHDHVQTTLSVLNERYTAWFRGSELLTVLAQLWHRWTPSLLIR